MDCIELNFARRLDAEKQTCSPESALDCVERPTWSFIRGAVCAPITLPYPDHRRWAAQVRTLESSCELQRVHLNPTLP